MTRRSAKLTLQFDNLEGRALLSGARANLAGLAMARPAGGQVSVARMNPGPALNAPSARVRVQPLRGAMLRALNDDGGDRPDLGVTRVRDTFRNRRDGSVDYTLSFESGGFRFRHTYKLDLDRDNGNNNDDFGNGGFGGAGLDRFGAVDLFFQSLQDRNAGGTGGGFVSDGDDFRNADSSFSQRGGRTRYDLQFDSGAFNFDQNYRLNVSRIRGNNNRNGGFNDGNGGFGVSAIEAVDLFYQSLTNRLAADAGNGFDDGTDDSSRF